MKRYYTNFLLVLLLLTAAAFAQNVDDDFNKGLILYRNHQYQAAEANFLSLVNTDQPHEKMAIATLMLAKTYLNMQEYDAAISTAENLIRNYSSSRYKSDAFYIIGTARYYQGQIQQSLTAFAFVLENADDSAMQQQAEKVAAKIAISEASLGEIQNLLDMRQWKAAKPYIQLWLAQKNYQKGKSDAGAIITSEIAENTSNPQILQAVESIRNQNWASTSDHVRIGVVLPISGIYSYEANDFLRGMAFALKKRPDINNQIDLIVKDSKGSLVDLIKETNALFDENIDLVVGELEGSKSATLAALAQNKNVPVIVPVTTDNGIASLGDYVFQANNDILTRGQALAEYAFNELGLRTFATLAPADDYGHELTDAFTSTIDKLGGTIVSQQWYYAGTEDFKTQFESIRRAGFNLAFRDSLQNMGLASTKAKLDSMTSVWNSHSRRSSDDGLGLVKNYDIPVHSIDGFFLPVYEEDMPLIASQMALANIKSHLLGGEYWNNSDILKRQQRYVNGLVMVSGHYLDPTNLDYITFVRDFRIQTTTTPQAMAYYGYNVMNLILQAISAGDYDGRDIAQYLNQLDDFHGLGIDVSFKNHHRVNKKVNLLQFVDGNIIELTQ